MTEKTAEIDQLKGATLEDISAMVESITREFKNKQQQLQPLIAELKVCTCLVLVFVCSNVGVPWCIVYDSLFVYLDDSKWYFKDYLHAPFAAEYKPLYFTPTAMMLMIDDDD